MTTETDKILVPEEQSGAPESTADTQETTPVAAQADEPATQETDGEEAPAAVDFTDEEAELAADAPEFDLGEEDESGNTDESSKEEGSAATDYSGKSKSELLALLSDLLANKPVQTIRRDVEAIKIAFYKAYRPKSNAPGAPSPKPGAKSRSSYLRPTMRNND